MNRRGFFRAAAVAPLAALAVGSPEGAWMETQDGRRVPWTGGEIRAGTAIAMDIEQVMGPTGPVPYVVWLRPSDGELGMYRARISSQARVAPERGVEDVDDWDAIVTVRERYMVVLKDGTRIHSA